MSAALTTAFLDRDGVINRKPPEGHYVTGVEGFEPLPGSIEAISRLSRAGLRVIVVTNQQGVAKGVVSPQSLAAVHRRLHEQVRLAGGRIDEILVCPHMAGSCDCRKPAIGLFEQAREHDPGIEFAQSVVVGDADSDIEAAQRIGALAIRVTGADEEPARARPPGGGRGPRRRRRPAAGARTCLSVPHRRSC